MQLSLISMPMYACVGGRARRRNGGGERERERERTGCGDSELVRIRDEEKHSFYFRSGEMKQRSQMKVEPNGEALSHLSLPRTSIHAAWGTSNRTGDCLMDQNV